MMLISILTLLFSFLLQGLASNYQGYTIDNLSWFITIYPLINLLILIPYFEESKKIITLVIIFGILTDFVYTNTLILNACLFIIIYYISKKFHFYFPYNLLTINISNIISITIYHTLSFIILIALKYDKYTLQLLGKTILHSIPMTIIYTSILYLIISKLFTKNELKEIK